MKATDADAVHAALMREFEANPAPVIDLMGAQGASAIHILLATILSARTRDECTAKVVRERLIPAISSWDDIRALPVEALDSMIRPVGFHRQKAEAIKKIPDVLQEKFGGTIPQTVEELCQLPGVGRKTANLVVAVAFKKPAICVDVHVHRIMNRMGLVRTKTPVETEMALREKLPQHLWRTWNAIFVSHGQRICKPRNPKCRNCAVSRFCDSARQA